MLNRNREILPWKRGERKGGREVTRQDEREIEGGREGRELDGDRSARNAVSRTRDERNRRTRERERSGISKKAKREVSFQVLF